MIFSAIRKLFAPDPFLLPAHEVYVALVERSRSPFFYQECGVSDTLDGRFDVIVLHMFLLTERFSGDSQDFLRALWEVFFSDMDRNLREMGASDTGIGKRVKKMAQAFYGRMDSYDKSFVRDADFKESLKRNLYRSAPVEEEKLDDIIEYTRKNLEFLQKQDISAIIGGKIEFLR